MARRMACKGNKGFAITDHADFSNISFVLSNLRRLELNMDFLIGVEITHVPPELTGKACKLAWRDKHIGASWFNFVGGKSPLRKLGNERR